MRPTILRFLVLVLALTACTDITAGDAQRPHSAAARKQAKRPPTQSGPLVMPVTNSDFVGEFTVTGLSLGGDELLATGSYSGELNGEAVSGAFTDLPLMLSAQGCRKTLHFVFDGETIGLAGVRDFHFYGTVSNPDGVYCELERALDQSPRDEAAIQGLLQQINAALAG